MPKTRELPELKVAVLTETGITESVVPYGTPETSFVPKIVGIFRESYAEM